MQKLLIACRAVALADSLQALLCQEFQVFTCTRGDHALSILEEQHPHAVIIDFGLPYLDGLSVLKEASFRPAAVLALSDLSSEYIHFSVHDIGIDYIVPLPCNAKMVCNHLQTILQYAQKRVRVLPTEKYVAEHLDRLGYDSSRAGYRQICVAALLFQKDPAQNLEKELYPAVAEICGKDNGDQIESSIRVLTTDTWKIRNKEIWLSYFPNAKKRPSNKRVIRTMSELIPEELL